MTDKERSNSIYSMHTIDMMFNNSISIMVGMSSKKIEKEKPAKAKMR